MGAFLEEWKSLYQSKSGERGIFNRAGVKKKMKRLGRRDHDKEWGTNPCGEISLRPMQFCNLSEVVIRPEDTLDTLRDKVELATILGTIQSTFTNFRYLRNTWKKNVEEERLLGVSFTGIFDNKATCDLEPFFKGVFGSELSLNEGLEALRIHAVETNKEWAAKLGIAESTSVSCVKPAGTTSSLSGTASGIHPRHSRWYIRSVRQDNKDPLTQFLKDQGVPAEPCVVRPESTTVFMFPMKAPEGSVTKSDLSAIDHLELWQKYNTFWAEHQVSVTVSIQESEWVGVAAWVYDNFDALTGVSFLPADQGSYRQAPFQAITEEEYNEAQSKMPKTIDWSQLSKYELEDTTTGMKELACVAGACEI